MQSRAVARGKLPVTESAGRMDVEKLEACPLCQASSIRVLDSANVCECKKCGFVFNNPRPTVNALIAFYSQPSKYDSWLAEEHARDALWIRRLKQLIPLAKSGSLLDVGAGIGQFLAIARPHFTEVCGTEVSESAIQIAREKYDIKLLSGEIQEVDFGSKKFDNITIFHVLEHVPNPRAVIEKCASLLTDGGVLAVAVPNDLYTLRGRRLFNTFLTRWFGYSSGVGLPKIVLDGSLAEIHLSHFTPSVLQRLFERCGFTVIANALDPYYAATGFNEWKHVAFYSACLVAHSISRLNLYDTMLLVGRKNGIRP